MVVFRWRLEELRVSFFVLELRTPHPAAGQSTELKL
jgi:hypothetical protein